MPTILRFGAFRIMVYTDDHRPPHVHATDGTRAASFWLHCDEPRVSLREKKRVADHTLAQLQRFVAAHVVMLCEAWDEVHGK